MSLGCRILESIEIIDSNIDREKGSVVTITVRFLTPRFDSN